MVFSEKVICTNMDVSNLTVGDITSTTGSFTTILLNGETLTNGGGSSGSSGSSGPTVDACYNLILGDSSFNVTKTSDAAYNIACGYKALNANTSGSNNLAIGYNTLDRNTTGSNNTAIGYNTNVGSNNLDHATVIGADASVNESNTVVIGRSSDTVKIPGSLYVNGTQVTSDLRDKTNVESIPNGLDFINQLNPVQFTWNMRNGNRVGVDDLGFIAQELQQAQVNSGITVPNLVHNEDPEHLTVSYQTLLPLAIKAIQELEKRVKELEANK